MALPQYSNPKRRKRDHSPSLYFHDFPPSNPIISPKVPFMFQGTKAIEFTQQDVSNLAHELRFSLIAKFSHGFPKFKHVDEHFKKLGLKGWFEIGEIDCRHLFIQLEFEEDSIRLCTKHKEPLMLNGFPMRIFKWTPDFKPKAESSLVPIWITLPRLPIYLFGKEALFAIGELIGRPLEVDEPTCRLPRPSSARILVEIDLCKEQVEEVWIDVPSGGFVQQIIYERKLEGERTAEIDRGRNVDSVKPTGMDIRIVTWKLPAHNRPKLNTDGCSRGNPGKAAGGGVLRDDKGSVLWAFRCYFGEVSNIEAELGAVLLGLRLCWKRGHHKIWVELDAQSIIQMVQSEKESDSQSQHFQLLQKVKILIGKMDTKITHILREGNSVADCLANEACDGERNAVFEGKLCSDKVKGLVALDRLETPYVRLPKSTG